MIKKIIISADEDITCPKCAHHFPLSESIARQTIERYESEFDEVFSAQKKELEASIEKEAERKATKQFAEQIALLQEKLQDSKTAEEHAKKFITKAQVDAKAKAQQEFESEKKALSEELLEKDNQLNGFRMQEMELRKQKRALEDKQANMDLELQRKLEDERTKMIDQISASETARFSMIEAEYKKKIEDALRANEDLTRKLNQGSQQLQGEVLELELEYVLTTSFLHDQIDEVKKGQRGADVLHTVRTVQGIECGKIIWEAKRAENWTDKWLHKLKDDQQEAKADIAVLVTTAMPKGVDEVIVRIGDVWVVSPHVIKPVAEMLRVVLLEANKLKMVNTGRNEKMELLYNYLSSAQFSQKIRTMLEAFESMRTDLEAEKRAMQKIWSKRQTQIERVTTSMTTVVGELQGIAHEALPQLENIEMLEAIGDEE
ncbi:MAG: DUF2130 domain-containing protein [Methylotenera sp.]